MAEEPRRTSTRRAILSYDQLKKLTVESGSEWPDLLVKDYQGILQDTAFLADETDAVEKDLTERVEILEYKSFTIVPTTESLQISGFQIIICKNTNPIDVTLDPDALLDDEAHIKRRGGVVNVIGTIDGFTNKKINIKNYSMHLVFDGTDWSEI